MATAGERAVVSVEPLSLEAVRALLAPQVGPCLSLYQPTHRNVPDNTVDLPTFRRLVDGLESKLATAHPRHEIERLLSPFRCLATDADFWRHTRDGLAVLASDGRAHGFLLQRPVKPLAVVMRRYHLLPLVRLAAASGRCHVLALTSREAQLFEGTIWHDPAGTVLGRLDPVALIPLPGHAPGDALLRADVIDPEQLQPHRVERGLGPRGKAGPTAVHGGVGSKQDDIDADTEIFLRHVDEVVIDQASRPLDLPLVLVAGPRVAATFRGLSKNPLLLEAAVATSPHLMRPEDLASAVAGVFATAASAQVAREIDRFREARSHGRAAGDLSDVGRAAVAGRVATLLVEADRAEPGRFDRATGAVEFAGAARSDDGGFDHEDVVAAVAETVLAHGGGIVAVPRIDMPTESGVAAIYRC
jgi:hypothetical protein